MFNQPRQLSEAYALEDFSSVFVSPPSSYLSPMIGETGSGSKHQLVSQWVIVCPSRSCPVLPQLPTYIGTRKKPKNRAGGRSPRQEPAARTEHENRRKVDGRAVRGACVPDVTQPTEARLSQPRIRWTEEKKKKTTERWMRRAGWR